MTTTDPIGCSPVCIQFTSNSTSVGSDIVYTHWLFGDGSTSQLLNFERCFLNNHPTDDITHDLRLVVMNDLGCSDTIAIADYIEVYHNPTAGFMVNPFETNMYFPDFVVYNQSVGADSYLWDFDDGNTSTDFELLHTYADTGTYDIHLTTWTDFGCTDETTQRVVVRPVVNLYIPNAFTPDGDGVNDVFFFTGYGIMRSDLEFTIHNRWGELIFRTTDFIPWDGTLNGQACPEGVYVYAIRYRDTAGGFNYKQGHVTLLR
jgi:gliding motility-associated-like protein